jgi:hypothetical protein
MWRIVGGLLLFLRRDVRTAVAACKRYWNQEFPDEPATWFQIIAVEDERIVVAVFYRPRNHARPAPYRLLAVARETQEVRELMAGEHARYQLRGRK